MCVIVSKDKGVELPSKKLLRACWDRNPDGAGIMFNNEKGKVEVHKGFMDFKSLWDFLEVLGRRLDIKNTAVVIHFRIGTSGKNDAPTCHPYPLSNKVDKLRCTDFTSEIAVAHNGIISDFVERNSILNDTQNFIRYVLYPMYRINKHFIEKDEGRGLVYTLTNKGRYNRFAFLDGNGNITRIGDWQNDNGVYYSNLNHVPKRIVQPSFATFYKKNKIDYEFEELDDCRMAYRDIFCDEWTYMELQKGDVVSLEGEGIFYIDKNNTYYEDINDNSLWKLDHENMIADFFGVIVD